MGLVLHPTVSTLFQIYNASSRRNFLRTSDDNDNNKMAKQYNFMQVEPAFPTIGLIVQEIIEWMSTIRYYKTKTRGAPLSLFALTLTQFQKKKKTLRNGVNFIKKLLAQQGGDPQPIQWKAWLSSPVLFHALIVTLPPPSTPLELFFTFFFHLTPPPPLNVPLKNAILNSFSMFFLLLSWTSHYFFGVSYRVPWDSPLLFLEELLVRYVI